jgi:hypothetical protein
MNLIHIVLVLLQEIHSVCLADKTLLRSQLLGFQLNIVTMLVLISAVLALVHQRC